MWNIIILIVLFIITGTVIYTIEKLFEENIEIRPEGRLDFIDISTNYIIVFSMENCRFCESLKDEYISKTKKQWTIITYKKDGTFNFDNNFTDIPLLERESILLGLTKLLNGEFVFPTIIHNKKIIRGLSDKSILDKIFND